MIVVVSASDFASCSLRSKREEERLWRQLCSGCGCNGNVEVDADGVVGRGEDRIPLMYAHGSNDEEANASSSSLFRTMSGELTEWKEEGRGQIEEE